MTTFTVVSPLPLATYVVSSGNVYVSDQYALIRGVASTQDLDDLLATGAFQLNPPPTDRLGFKIAANFNTKADQLISIQNNVRFRVRRIVVLNASVSLTTAVGGFYTGASKTGTTIVANTQVYSSLTGGTVCLEPTLNAPNTLLAAGTPLFLSLTTPQGVAATADVYVYGDTYVTS